MLCNIVAVGSVAFDCCIRVLMIVQLLILVNPAVFIFVKYVQI